jgi:ABC-type multidrug transport system fused ATPase/permease subunit
MTSATSSLDSQALDTVFPASEMPKTLLTFVARFSGWHQLALSAMSVIVFLLEAAPLEIQRRIVNDAYVGGAYADILILALIYLGLAFGQGLLKLLMNIYQSWVGEKAVRSLRSTVSSLAQRTPANWAESKAVGIETSMMLAETEPIGAFTGIYLSEPVLQGGILLSIFVYMVYLQPMMSLVAFVVFAPQIVFVPIMQSAINRRVARRIATLREVSGGIILGAAENTVAARELQSRRIDDVFTLNMGIYELKFSMNFLMNFLHHVGTAGVLAAGGWFVVAGQTEVGTVVAFLSGLSRISGPWGDLVSWFRDLTVTGTKYNLISCAVRDLAFAET